MSGSLMQISRWKDFYNTLRKFKSEKNQNVGEYVNNFKRIQKCKKLLHSISYLRDLTLNFSTGFLLFFPKIQYSWLLEVSYFLNPRSLWWETKNIIRHFLIKLLNSYQTKQYHCYKSSANRQQFYLVLRSSCAPLDTKRYIVVLTIFISRYVKETCH